MKATIEKKFKFSVLLNIILLLGMMLVFVRGGMLVA